MLELLLTKIKELFGIKASPSINEVVETPLAYVEEKPAVVAKTVRKKKASPKKAK
jgi:hypothetical protein